MGRQASDKAVGQRCAITWEDQGVSAPAIHLDVSGAVARLTFVDSARGNPIDERFCSEISEAAIVISKTPGVRAVLISAEGKTFSVGGDISSFTADFDALPANILRWTTTLHSAVARLQRMNAPIVAAVHGICAGGMSGFIAGCDIVIASEKAKFVAAYAGIGFCCDASSSVTYSRRMGPARARRFLLLNETLDAAAALSAGLVDEVTAADTLEDRSEQVAAQLAAGPTQAFGEVRRLLLSAMNTPLESQLELEAQALSRISATRDAREGLTAFADKRKPEFSGR